MGKFSHERVDNSQKFYVANLIGTLIETLNKPKVQKTKIVVGTAGFEPTTPCTQNKCATKLRHAPTLRVIYKK